MAILIEKLTDICKTRENDERWLAVLFRDIRSDGIFVPCAPLASTVGQKGELND